MRNKGKYKSRLIFCFLTMLLKLDGQQAIIYEYRNILVLKIEYTNSKYPEQKTIAYTLISADKLEAFKIHNDSSKNSPNIAFNITCNGGYYISETFVDLYALGCFEYGNIEKAVEQNVKGTLSKDKLIEYNNVNGLNTKIFKKKNGVEFKFKKETAKYIISVYMTNMNYYVCDLYMESPKQNISGRKGVYVKNIYSIKKPSNIICKKLEQLFQDIIKVDTNQ